jgi:hypothetical protein
VTPGRRFEGIIFTYVFNVVASVGLSIFGGLWLIPMLKVIDFVVISLIVREV